VPVVHHQVPAVQPEELLPLAAFLPELSQVPELVEHLHQKASHHQLVEQQDLEE
jgi:hypothetical protein